MTCGVSVEEIRSNPCSAGRPSAITTRDLVMAWCSTELEWASSAACSTPTLRRKVTRHVRGYLGILWRTGALRGEQPRDAFSVTCDMATRSEADLRDGTLICRVEIAPAGSSEFVFLRIRIRLQSPSTPLAAA